MTHIDYYESFINIGPITPPLQSWQNDNQKKPKH